MTSPPLAGLDPVAPGPWIARLPEVARAPARRALALDGALWRDHPAGLTSLLLLRLRGLAPPALICAWEAEVAARGRPWVQPLRGLAAPEGLVAVRYLDPSLKMAGLTAPGFDGDGVVLWSRRELLPWVERPESDRRDRLRWAWAGDGAASLEPDPTPFHAHAAYPRAESRRWGPATRLRRADDPGVALPCPTGGTAWARPIDGGRAWIVYGSHDEYDGGFAWFVRDDDLAITRRIETPRPVSRVRRCEDPDLLLLETYGGLVLVRGERQIPLPGGSRPAGLSPSGRYVACQQGARRLEIWEASATRGAPARSGFAARFDPDGARLICGPVLYDGLTGEVVADLDPRFGSYLEGGPAQPSLHLGSRHLVSLHGGLKVWDTATGARLKPGHRMRAPQWFTVGYDRAGARLARLRRGGREVAVFSLPDAATIAEITFDRPGVAVALSPDGQRVAVADGASMELRGLDGGLIAAAGEPTEPDAFRRSGRVRFVGGGRLLSEIDDAGRWLWAPGAEPVAGASAAPPAEPPGWSVTSGAATVFTHIASGARIALPVAGPWRRNPADPRVLASQAAHVALRG